MTESFVAIARADVVQVEIDGELVLYDDEARVMHRLSPTAGQVWRCLDGSGSLAEIAADLADVYQADPAQVLADVVVTARQFGSVGLIVGVGDPSRLEDGTAPFVAHPTQGHMDGRFVVVPSTGGMDASFPLRDAGSLSVQVAGMLLGVRFSTPELVEMAKHVLAPSLVEGVVAPPNVSVKLTTARSGRSLLYCYRSTMLVTRARSPQRAFEAVARLLTSYLPPDQGAIRVAALCAVRSGVAALFDAECWAAAARLVPRLRAAGWEVLDAPEVDIEPEGHVVVPPLAVTLDRAALANLPAGRFDGNRPAPGRYRVAVWVSVAEDIPMAEGMAARVARVAAGIPELDPASVSPALDTIAALLRDATWAVSPTDLPNDLVATLASAVA